MSTRRVTSDELERVAFDNRQPIDFDGDYAFCTVGSVEYIAQIEVQA
jgi:hypothetical protein